MVRCRSCQRITQIGRILTLFSFLVLCAPTGILHAEGNAEENGTSPGTGIAIAFTSSLNGNILGCDCKGHPRSGLAKSAVLLREIKRNGGILVDCGDILPPEKDELLADAIFSAYRDIGYDFITIGDQEFGGGIPEFSRILSKKLPLASANMQVTSNGSSLSLGSGYRVFTRSGIKIGIGAVIDPSVFTLYPRDIKDSVRISDPQEGAAAILDSMTADGCQVKILVFHGPVDAAEAVVRTVPGFTAVIVGHEQRLIEERKGQTLLLSPGEEGNRVGLLRVSAPAGGKGSPEISVSFTLFSYETDPDDPEVKRLADEYMVKLRALIQAAPAGK